MTRDPYWQEFKRDLLAKLNSGLRREQEMARMRIHHSDIFKPNNGAVVVRREVE